MSYIGYPDGGVFIEHPGQRARVLDPQLKLRNHSPTGFAWGYSGSGPAQLALAILVDHFHNETPGFVEHFARALNYAHETLTAPEWLALHLYQDFKAAVIARLPQNDGFVLSEKVVNEALEKILVHRQPPPLQDP